MLRRLFSCSLLLTTSCLGGFENPSAYAREVFLCEPERASQLTAEVERCEKEWNQHENPGPGDPGPGCAGVVSMTGTLQGRTFTFSATRLAATTFRRAEVTGSPELLFDSVEFSGSSPYFLFSLQFAAVGGLAENDPGGRELRWSVGATSVNPPLARFQDTLVRGDLRIENGRESVASPALNDSGALRIKLQGSRVISGSFDASFRSSNDHIEGCFQVWATEIRRAFF